MLAAAAVVCMCVPTLVGWEAEGQKGGKEASFRVRPAWRTCFYTIEYDQLFDRLIIEWMDACYQMYAFAIRKYFASLCYRQPTITLQHPVLILLVLLLIITYIQE
jgi:hypothetical protein